MTDARLETRKKMTETKLEAQQEILRNRLVKRCRHLRKWARRISTNAFRLYDRDIPEIPLVLDIYGDAVSGALYKRPYEKDEAEEAIWLDAMKKAVSQALAIPENRIFLKTRQKQKGNSQYTRQDSVGFWADIEENGLRFRVNLSDYLDTGLFLDARPRRSMLISTAKNKSVLNLFSYTCSLSVCAAYGKAAETDSVDMSNSYLEWGAVNFGLNNMEAKMISERDFWQADTDDCRHRLIRADVLNFLQKAALRGKKWDIVILDPPAFSNSKKMIVDLDIKRDYINLINQCRKLLNPGGTIWFSVNARGFRFDADKFSEYEIRTPDITDEDFKKTKPGFWILTGKT